MSIKLKKEWMLRRLLLGDRRGALIHEPSQEKLSKGFIANKKKTPGQPINTCNA